MGISLALFRFRSYLQFLWRSTNRHGLHSPFVYRYATDCLYQRPMHPDRSVAVLLGSLAYFKVANLRLEGRPNLKETVEDHFPGLRDHRPLDLIYTQGLTVAQFQGLLAQGQLHNDSLILVDQIHRDPERQRAWKALAELPQVKVSIDLFHCGLLLLRREQEKEHFCIRI